MGMNKTHYDGVDLQYSCNMIIIRNGEELSLINTIRLNDEGLSALDSLGKVKNVIRIGAFHSINDAFYLDRYPAKLCAIKGMQPSHNRPTDIELVPNGFLPIPDSELVVFETSVTPEGALYIAREGGILITCNSVKNWLNQDQFFNDGTVALYKRQGFFGAATISNIWMQATQVNSLILLN